jgi:hypothetical protein
MIYDPDIYIVLHDTVKVRVPHGMVQSVWYPYFLGVPEYGIVPS